MLFTDIVLESLSAIVLLVLVGYLWRLGRTKKFNRDKGWKLIQTGFLLILFGTFLDITDNFDSLNRFTIIGDTKIEAFLEKVVGYLAGFTVLTVGLIRWGPSVEHLMNEVAERKKSEAELKKIRHELESIINDRTHELEEEIANHQKDEKSLRESEERFRTLFHQSPLGVTFEDYSLVKRRIDQLRTDGVTDLRQHYNEHGDELRQTVQDIRLIDANQAQFELYGTSTFDSYKEDDADFDAWGHDNWRDFYIGEFTSLVEGRHTYIDEFRDYKADGTPVIMRCTTRLAQGCEEDWSEIISIHEDITAQKTVETQLLQQATIDPVTSLPNRVLFFDRLAQAIEHAKRESRSIGLIYVDLDRFKQVNDSQGHTVGDQLLAEVGKRLKNTIRHEDTVARIGGDEFTIILNDIEIPHGPETVAMKIVESFKEPFTTESGDIFITASLGVAIYPDDGMAPDTLLQNADAAMYGSKQQGRDTFRFFTQGLNDQAEQHARIAERLRHALDRGELELFFQPIVDVSTNHVSAIEALIRWNDPVLKTVDAEELILVAEETGFVSTIENWVLQESCKLVVDWRSGIVSDLNLNVNISRSHFLSADFIDVVQNALSESGLPAFALTVEVTEKVFKDETREIAERLKELNEMGVNLALDDFGTGYSSLGSLKKLKVDALKVDRIFVENIASSSNDLAVVEAIIAMSKSMNLQIIIEGVETPDQLELLQERGCRLIQGFHFSQPLSVDELRGYLEASIPAVDRSLKMQTL